MDESDNYEAIKMFTSAIEHGYKNANPLYNRARCYQKLGMHEDAIRDFQEYMTHEPDDYAPHYQLGNIHSDQSLHELALEDFTKSIERDSKLKSLLVDRAHTYRELEEYEMALADLELFFREAKEKDNEHEYKRAQELRDELKELLNGKD